MKKIVIWTVLATLVLLAMLVYQFSPYKQTAELLDAIKAGDAFAVEQLLAEGVDPNKTDVPPSKLWSLVESSARRPLSIASAEGNLEIVKLLVKHGATAEYREYTGWSPLRAALLRYDPDDLEMVRLLLENGADPEVVEAGHNAVFAAADMFVLGENTRETEEGITALARLLIGDRTVEDMREENGVTLLMYAARRGNGCLVQYLLTQGCDPNLMDHRGYTAADYAEDAGKTEILVLLGAG